MVLDILQELLGPLRLPPVRTCATEHSHRCHLGSLIPGRCLQIPTHNVSPSPPGRKFSGGWKRGKGHMLPYTAREMYSAKRQKACFSTMAGTTLLKADSFSTKASSTASVSDLKSNKASLIAFLGERGSVLKHVLICPTADLELWVAKGG